MNINRDRSDCIQSEIWSYFYGKKGDIEFVHFQPDSIENKTRNGFLSESVSKFHVEKKLKKKHDD